MRPTKGFSLIEVVLALGIVSFGMLAILGLLSVGNDTNRSARDETAAAQLATNEFDRIRALSAANFPSTYDTRYFDASLIDLGVERADALRRGGVYEVRMQIAPLEEPSAADRICHAEVRFPAVSQNPTIVRFTTLMNVPR